MKRYFSLVYAGLLGAVMILSGGNTYAQTLQPACVDGEGLGGSRQPAGMARDASGFIWVALFEASEVVKVALDGTIGNQQPCGVAARISVGTNPNFVAFDGTSIWVTNEGSNSVTKINPASNTVVGTYSVGSGPRGVVFDGTYIWVANYLANTVSKLDPSSGGTLGTFSVGSGPWNVAVNTNDHTIWVSNRNSNNVMKLNQSGSVLLTVATDQFPEFFAFDGANMWVSCYATQTIEEISDSGTILKRQGITGHGQPLGLAWDNVSGVLWGVTHGAYLYSFNPSTGALTYSFTGGGQNYAILFDPTPSFVLLWVTDLSGGVIEASY